MSLRLYLTLILLNISLISAFSQSINSLYKLDSVVDTKIKVNYSNFSLDNYIAKEYNQNLYVYCPTWDDNDTLTFYVLNLSTYKSSYLKLYVPSISFHVGSPLINDFDINSDNLVVIFGTKALLTFSRQNSGGYNFTSLVPLTELFERVFLLGNGKILLDHLYNSNPESDPQATSFCVYSIKWHKLFSSALPWFSSVAFCHFSPNNWVDVCDGNIFFAQTAVYKIDELNDSLKTINQLRNYDKNWIMADTALVNAYRAVKPRIPPKTVIDYMSPMEDTVSRIEAVYALDPTHLLVRKIPPYNKAAHRIRTIDIWSMKYSKWSPIATNLIDSLPAKEDVLNKSNYPLQSVYDAGFFRDNYFIRIAAKFTTPEFNTTYESEVKKENNQFGKATPTYKIFVYKSRK